LRGGRVGLETGKLEEGGQIVRGVVPVPARWQALEWVRAEPCDVADIAVDVEGVRPREQVLQRHPNDKLAVRYQDAGDLGQPDLLVMYVFENVERFDRSHRSRPEGQAGERLGGEYAPKLTARPVE